MHPLQPPDTRVETRTGTWILVPNDSPTTHSMQRNHKPPLPHNSAFVSYAVHYQRNCHHQCPAEGQTTVRIEASRFDAMQPRGVREGYIIGRSEEWSLDGRKGNSKQAFSPFCTTDSCEDVHFGMGGGEGRRKGGWQGAGGKRREGRRNVVGWRRILLHRVLITHLIHLHMVLLGLTSSYLFPFIWQSHAKWIRQRPSGPSAAWVSRGWDFMGTRNSHACVSLEMHSRCRWWSEEACESMQVEVGKGINWRVWMAVGYPTTHIDKWDYPVHWEVPGSVFTIKCLRSLK